FERSVVEASKQCGRNRLMQIAQPAAWNDFIAAGGTALRLVAHPGGIALAEAAERNSLGEEIRLAVGPEGGLTDAELQQASAAGWQAVDLGCRVLRVETAAVAMIAAVTLNQPST